MISLHAPYVCLMFLVHAFFSGVSSVRPMVHSDGSAGILNNKEHACPSSCTQSVGSKEV